ncbi:MAG TPA: NADH-quinone oxidoreductase subunit H [Candidatus Cloacimonadota bacterium]|nr:NADH-quinone oxidoreductase subunit H [Candidatus Cloacimonadota bacterium]
MILNLLTILVLPLLMIGIINRIKAIMVGRKGQSVLQPWYHFIKLLGKPEVRSHTGGFITLWAPLVALGVTLCAALFVPFLSPKSILAFKGDFLLLVYLLAMAKAAMVLAALDTGSSFEGMGASREISFTAFLEPAMMLVMGALMYAIGIRSVSDLVLAHAVDFSDIWSILIALMTALALFIMLLVESARVPFDDPATHLELTMIHEVMILDYSGFSLALIHYTAALKMLIFASLISYLMIPAGLSLSPYLYLLIVVILCILIGKLESLSARFRMTRNLEFVLIPLTISLFVIAALIARDMGAW